MIAMLACKGEFFNKKKFIYDIVFRKCGSRDKIDNIRNKIIKFEISHFHVIRIIECTNLTESQIKMF